MSHVINGTGPYTQQQASTPVSNGYTNPDVIPATGQQQLVVRDTALDTGTVETRQNMLNTEQQQHQPGGHR